MRRFRFLAFMLSLALAFAGGMYLAGYVRLPGLGRAAPPPLGIRYLEEGFSGLVDRTRPAIVNLRVEVLREAAAPWYQRPFRRLLPELVPKPTRVLEGRDGSGFILRSDGCILTNAHVVERARHIRVTLADGRETWGRLVATDRERDLALVKVKSPRPLPTLGLGDVSRIRPGSLVLVAGSPLRFEFTFSQGIVSALGRSVKSEQSKVTYRRMIQTDAAVNQGSSGGPLIDVHGQAVGVITALYSPSGTDSGVAFAIPMDSQTRRVIARMMRGV